MSLATWRRGALLSVLVAGMVAACGSDDAQPAGNGGGSDGGAFDGAGTDGTVDGNASDGNANVDSANDGTASTDSANDAHKDGAADSASVDSSNDVTPGDVTIDRVASDADPPRDAADGGCGTKADLTNNQGGGTCTIIESWMCTTDAYEIDCACPAATCQCMMNGNAVGAPVAYGGCGTCTSAPFSTIAAACGIPY